MVEPKLAKLELQIMDVLWTRSRASIREIQETFPEKDRPAYTTIQTTVYRLEGEKGRAPRQEGRELSHLRSRGFPQCRAAEIDRRPVGSVRRTHATRMAHLIESGKLTLEDVKEAEKTLRKLERKDISQ